MIKLVKLYKGVKTPTYETEESAGVDICAYCPEDLCIHIYPNKTVLIPTGISIDWNNYPFSVEAQLRLRSSVALNTPLIMPNSPATIDKDYKKELFIMLRNTGDNIFTVWNGDRLAQLVFNSIVRPYDIETKPIKRTGGFGSTNT